MVKRNGTMLIPRGDLMLREGDHIILYSLTHVPDADQITI
jgi:Trk K+ transport system NAD-binding subunit